MSGKPTSVVPDGRGDGEGGRAGGRAREAWRLEPHICRLCHSRLVSAPGTDGRRHYHCTNCGADVEGQTVAALCCCGTKLRRAARDGRTSPVEFDAGIRCVPNPNPTPEFPSVYVAIERPGR